MHVHASQDPCLRPVSDLSQACLRPVFWRSDPVSGLFLRGLSHAGGGGKVIAKPACSEVLLLHKDSWVASETWAWSESG